MSRDEDVIGIAGISIGIGFPVHTQPAGRQSGNIGWLRTKNSKGGRYSGSLEPPE